MLATLAMSMVPTSSPLGSQAEPSIFAVQSYFLSEDRGDFTLMLASGILVSLHWLDVFLLANHRKPNHRRLKE